MYPVPTPSPIDFALQSCWEIKLRVDATPLDHLKYFHPSYMSLMKPHPLCTTCSSNPFEVNKAIIQARMLSGRYMTDQLSRHWTHNKAGLCLLSGCNGYSVGSLEHILLECPALHSTRKKMVNFCINVAQKNSTVKDIILAALSSREHTFVMQFLLDCSSLPSVIALQQIHGQVTLSLLFHATRNWCYSIHRTRMDLLGLYQFR